MAANFANVEFNRREGNDDISLHVHIVGVPPKADCKPMDWIQLSGQANYLDCD